MESLLKHSSRPNDLARPQQTIVGDRGTLRAALLTPIGRGAVATIRLDGRMGQRDEALPFAARSGQPLNEADLNRCLFGLWGAESPEEVVVCRLSPDQLEIHCHGGFAAASRILGDLDQLGAAIVSWQALISQFEGLFAAESHEALARAPTVRCARFLLDQTQGTFARGIRQLIRVPSLPAIDAVLQWARFGLHLTAPWQVVLAGRPNAGKSSLVNCLLGYSRSIVSDIPGTTRDVVTADCAFDGWPVRLADTAGVHATEQPLEQSGIARAHDSLSTADVCLIVIDGSQSRSEVDDALLTRWPDAIRVLNKSDLPSAGDAPSGMSLSCLTGAGVAQLVAQVAQTLVPRLPPAGHPIPYSGRQVSLLRAARASLAAGQVSDCVARLEEILA